MDVQEILNKAQELRQGGQLKLALAAYSDAFDILTEEADEYARKIEGSVVDVGKLRTITAKLFEESQKYLKRDKMAAVISNNMGTIFAESEDLESAEKMFNQAIELTPDGLDYPDPKIGLESLNKIKK